MPSRYSVRIREEDGGFLEHLSSNIPHRLLHIDLNIRCISSLNPETTLETFDRSITGRRDVFLSEENARNIIHSMAADSGASREFIDTVIVPLCVECRLLAREPWTSSNQVWSRDTR
ncbi:hypothetical protein V6N13_046696 [Hibiscus sabdariffa]